MSKRKKSCLTDIISSIQENIVYKKPSFNEIKEEVKMMQFKIRPLVGNVLSLDFNNKRFIETLWMLGKMDGYFKLYYSQLSKRDREIFLNFFATTYKKFQGRLSRVKLKKLSANLKNNFFEVEIFKKLSKWSVN